MLQAHSYKMLYSAVMQPDHMDYLPLQGGRGQDHNHQDPDGVVGGEWSWPRLPGQAARWFSNRARLNLLRFWTRIWNWQGHRVCCYLCQPMEVVSLHIQTWCLPCWLQSSLLFVCLKSVACQFASRKHQLSSPASFTHERGYLIDYVLVIPHHSNCGHAHLPQLALDVVQVWSMEKRSRALLSTLPFTDCCSHTHLVCRCYRTGAFELEWDGRLAMDIIWVSHWVLFIRLV